MTADDPVLTVRGLHKRFGATHALRGIDLELVAGEVLALVGETGACKSTLVKILPGVHPPTEGEILLGGHARRFDSAQQAQGAGIVAVHQETVMFDELSAAENIFIGRQPMRVAMPSTRRKCGDRNGSCVRSPASLRRASKLDISVS